MSNLDSTARLEATIDITGDTVVADIRDRRPDALSFFQGIDDPQRAVFATEAWTIGLRALRNAQNAAEEARLKDIGGSLVADLDSQLKAHVESQQRQISTVLARFFDPKDGEVAQRLSAFLADEGVLARLLDRYLAPQNSVLAQALARQVGETSPLFKKLSPTDSEGLVKVLEQQLRGVMHAGHQEMVRALDPQAADGAVARFLRSLRGELKGAHEDRAKQLSAALAALDANNPDSLLNRLVRETNEARQEVLKAVNADKEGSPLEILKTSLTKLLQEQGTNQVAMAKAHMDRLAALDKDLREAVARIETRRTQDRKSTLGGFDFEDAVLAFLKTATQGAAVVLDSTGATAGLGRCKKGDAVLRFTNESAFAGAGVVLEAKRDAAYTVQKALDELDAARKNRDAVAGVFVMAKSHATEAFPAFARHGNNVLVIWDEEDASTNSNLQAAVMLGMGLATRSKKVGEPGDINALRDVGDRIESELKTLGSMEKHNESIRKHSDGISDDIRKARKGLETLVAKAQSTLRALNIAVEDEAAERKTPISLPQAPPEANPQSEDGAAA